MLLRLAVRCTALALLVALLGPAGGARSADLSFSTTLGEEVYLNGFLDAGEHTVH